MLGLVLSDTNGVCDLKPKMHTSRAWLESVSRTSRTPLLNGIKTICVSTFFPHLVLTPSIFCIEEMRLEMVYQTLHMHNIMYM